MKQLKIQVLGCSSHIHVLDSPVCVCWGGGWAPQDHAGVAEGAGRPRQDRTGTDRLCPQTLPWAPLTRLILAAESGGGRKSDQEATEAPEELRGPLGRASRGAGQRPVVDRC